MHRKRTVEGRRRVFLLIVALVATGVGVCLTLETGSARADEEGASSSEQLQACTQAALGEPEFNANKAATMNEPGNRESQYLFAVASLHKSSTDCLPLVRREGPRVFFKMQRPENHKAWIHSKSQEMITREDGYSHPRVLGDEGGRGEAALLAKSDGSPGLGKVVDSRFIYRCTPGRAVTQVKVVFVMTARGAVDGKVLGRRSYAAPVSIIHAIPGEPLLHGAVFKAC